ncbi:putative Potassium ion channel Yvc1 [Taphrina deformans PYCC 5710]|uniref:Potassium ion channel Yvc1 n=1 Tax=Taphrina deformans (strain PYCC 5710 / ATCC 11124 / CBS 356.35 / IMI 108563 / JCM 9778 / NBRC 8474) TaxID=1097556 RepID=R4XGT5_TAPDE|nr:putative Potassium ion channel Yvc1 [Taphrina deformans PYCC 5710]|eukprot:CCG82591.1 putative Potassium ion channel Yvc1 [Taphrina deformans PYCC 5710]
MAGDSDEEHALLDNQQSTAKSIPPARKITQVARKIRFLITELIPIVVKESHLTNPKSRIITPKVLDLIERAGESEPGCVVFCCVYVAKYFHRLCDKDLPDADVHVLRAIACEVIAKQLIERQEDEDFLYSEILLRRYSIVSGGQDSDPKSTVELAVDAHITRVISSGPYNNAMQKIWTGEYLVKYAEDESLQFTPNSVHHKSGFFEHYRVARASVPRYQNLLQITLSTVFLGLYTGTVNTANDDGVMDAVEVMLFLFVLGYLCDEVSKIYKVGKAYIAFWNAVNLMLYTVFAGAFVMRMVAFTIPKDSKKRVDLVIVSYQILSSAAPLMWTRMLLYLDNYRFFGVLMVVTQEMLKESLVFVALLVIIVIGFLQALLGFDSADGRLDVAVKILNSVLQSGLGSPAFELYEGSFALVLYYLFTFIMSIILLNILIALFNQAYSNVYDNADDEYLCLFAQKTLAFVRPVDEYVFVPPFNLVEVFVLLPFELVLSKGRYQALNDFILSILYAPYLALIALYEAKLHKRRIKVENGDFDDNELEDDEETDDTRKWAEICQKRLPSTETDMDILEDLRTRIKELEDHLQKP